MGSHARRRTDPSFQPVTGNRSAGLDQALDVAGHVVVLHGGLRTGGDPHLFQPKKFSNQSNVRITPIIVQPIVAYTPSIRIRRRGRWANV